MTATDQRGVFMAINPQVLQELRRISAERRAQEESGIAGPVSLPLYQPSEALQCPHMGAVIEWCHGCKSELKHVRECDLHEKCTIGHVSDKVHSCQYCNEHPTRVREREEAAQKVAVEAEKGRLAMIRTRWAYGVTTVPERREELLPRTLTSLKKAGFDSPTLFVDGYNNPESYRDEFGLEVVTRWPRIRTFGNWVLSLAELYIRNPDFERFAMFQDDILTCAGLREYLSRVTYPEKGYINLFTMPSNERVKPQGTVGFFRSNQFGRGALGLVFDNQTVVHLLTHLHMVERPKDVTKGHKNLDGGIVTALSRKSGIAEYVHSPSLVQHAGQHESSMGSKKQPLAPDFRGENWDVRTLLQAEEGKKVVTQI